MAITSLGISQGTDSWGGDTIVLENDVVYYNGIRRKDVYSGSDFIMYIARVTTAGSPVAGQFKISMKFYHNNATYWVNAQTSADGSYTHPLVDGEYLNGNFLIGATLTSTETENYAIGSYYKDGSTYSCRNWYYLDLTHILTTAGLTPATMQPERVDVTYYTRNGTSGSWTTSTSTFYMYGQDSNYPKLSYTYTGTGLVNNKYYEGVSTMTVALTITESPINGMSATKGINDNVTLSGGIDVNAVLNFATTDFTNAVATKSLSIATNSFYSTMYIYDNNGYTTADASFNISYFAYSKPSVLGTKVYRTGTDYDYVHIDGVGSYADETEYAVTLSYRWKITGGTYSSWTTLGTGAVGSTGPIEQSAEFLSAVSNGEVIVEVKVDDTLYSDSKEIYAGGPAIFNWDNNDFTFTVPVNFNVDEVDTTVEADKRSAIWINGISLADYIRSIS